MRLSVEGEHLATAGWVNYLYDARNPDESYLEFNVHGGLGPDVLIAGAQAYIEKSTRNGEEGANMGFVVDVAESGSVSMETSHDGYTSLELSISNPTAGCMPTAARNFGVVTVPGDEIRVLVPRRIRLQYITADLLATIELADYVPPKYEFWSVAVSWYAPGKLDLCRNIANYPNPLIVPYDESRDGRPDFSLSAGYPCVMLPQPANSCTQ